MSLYAGQYGIKLFVGRKTPSLPTTVYNLNYLRLSEVVYHTSSVSGIGIHPWVFVKHYPIDCNKVAGIMFISIGGQPIK